MKRPLLVFILVSACAAAATRPELPVITQDSDADFAKPIATGHLLTRPAMESVPTDRLLVVENDHQIHCIDGTGKEIWTADMEGKDWQMLGTAGGNIVVGSSDQLASIDAASGKVGWKSPRALSRAPIQMEGGLLLTQTKNGLEIRDVATGQLLSNPQFEGTVAQVAASKGQVIVLRSDSAKSLLQIDAKSGKIDTFPLKDAARWIGLVPNGNLLVQTYEHLAVYDLKAQRELWNVPILSQPYSPWPMVTESYIAAVDSDKSSGTIRFFGLDGKGLDFDQMDIGEGLNSVVASQSGAWHFLVVHDELVLLTPGGIVDMDTAKRRINWKPGWNVGSPVIVDGGNAGELFVFLQRGDRRGGVQTSMGAREQGGGRLVINRVIQAPDGSALDATRMPAWAILKDGIAFEIDGHIQVFHYTVRYPKP